MQERVSIREARKHLGEVVEAAERGQQVVLTRRGREVACVGPVTARDRTLPDLSSFRASLRVTGQPLSEAVVELRESERS